jgi:transcriptional regulator with XRE-family HTH domain
VLGVRLVVMTTDTPRTRRRLTTARHEGERETRALCARLGSELRAARLRKRLTQAQVGVLIGVHQSRISQMERGFGANSSVGIWIAFGIAVGRPLAISTSRSLIAEPREAGHLAAQELVLRLARAHGIPGSFELQTRPAPNATYIDVCLRNDRHRVLEVIEIWNAFEEIGAGARNFKRKLAEAQAIAVVAGGDGEPYRVSGC